MGYTVLKRNTGGGEETGGVTSEKMAPECDIVVKKRIASGLVYFKHNWHSGSF